MGTAVPLALFPFDHFVLLLEHFSAQGSEQGVCASVTRHHRLDSPQTKSQKQPVVLSWAEDLALYSQCSSTIKQDLIRQDAEQHLINSSVNGVRTAPQIPQKRSFTKSHVNATKLATLGDPINTVALQTEHLCRCWASAGVAALGLGTLIHPFFTGAKTLLRGT